MYHPDDTIAAVASAPGGAARGIVRLSGPGVVECVSRSFEPDQAVELADVTRPTMLTGCLNLGLASPLPCQVYLWPGRRSYTRQPSAELHTIGSPPLLEAALRRICQTGARLAAPGEFTLRAFLAGRIDLTQAEAVLGVIDATGRAQLDRALQQLAGGLATPLTALRNKLLDTLAHVEAGLDFVDEDIEFIAQDQVVAQLQAASRTVADLAARMAGRHQTADVVRIVLVGWPNVGKSSLYNALVTAGQALVSASAGTTRDYLSATLDLDGIACELIDTAGADPAASQPIEQAAQHFALDQRLHAHVEVLCLDVTRPLNFWERRQLTDPPDSVTRIVALTKTDQPPGMPAVPGAVATSSRSGAGLDRLRSLLGEAARSVQGAETDAVPATAARCRQSLERAAACLAGALEVAGRRGGDELLAAELRTALDELGQVVGAVYTDDILDRIFSRFCIGK
ncbi:MAG: tRNA modification GTPase [Pirellulales bacterium]